MPNTTRMQSAVINHSLHDRFNWAYVEFWVAYDADIKQVRELAVAAPLSSAHFAEHEPPEFWVMGMAERGVRCWVAAWADTPSAAWSLKCDIRESLLASFAEHRIHAHSYRVEQSLAA